MKDFKNKVAVVTGAGGSGIGNALVRALAQAGAHVAFCDIVNLEKTLEDIKNCPVQVYSEVVDIGNKEAINKFAANVLGKFGHVDILINNAGIATGDRKYEEMTDEDFEKITDVNYWGVIRST